MKIKNGLLVAVASLCLSATQMAFNRKPAEKDIYEIRVYRMKTNDQVTQVDNFLKNAYLPALHRLGVSKIGVFKNVGIDTAAEKSTYVLIPLRSLEGDQVELKTDLLQMLPITRMALLISLLPSTPRLIHASRPSYYGPSIKWPISNLHHLRAILLKGFMNCVVMKDPVKNYIRRKCTCSMKVAKYPYSKGLGSTPFSMLKYWQVVVCQTKCT